MPDGSVNFAFLGQFAETPRDTIFTTEYSMRTGMEAVYTLLNVDRGVPGGLGQRVRCPRPAGCCGEAAGRQVPADMEFSFIEKLALKKALSKIHGTDLEKLLKEYHIL